MKKKRLLSCVLIVALLLSLCAIGVGAVTVDDFTDVSSDDWFYDAVSEVTAAGYFNGTSATTFDPQLTMTRAMFVTVLARFDGATVDNSADTTFTDVPTGQYYTGAVAWAAENGLVQGYGGNAFGTSNPITRQDMAVLMTRYIAYYEAKNSVAATTSAAGSETTHDVVDDPAEFADAASIAAYATEAVVECANYGLLIGDDNGNFRPTSASTRAEAATVISRLSWTVEEIDRLSSGSSGGGGGGSTTYYLTLDPNGGTLTVSGNSYTEAYTVSSSSSTFTLSNYTVARDGYKLAGWTLTDAADDVEYQATYKSKATSSTSNNLVTLYAQWEEVTEETTYTLTYSFKDAVLTIGEGDTAETWYDTYPVEVTAGTVTVISEAPEKDGYTFNVWKDEDGNEVARGGTITVDGDIKLTADFVDAEVVIDTADKIGLSVEKAIANFNARVETVKTNLDTNIDGTNYTYLQTLAGEDFTAEAKANGWAVEDDTDPREVAVTIDAAVDADSLEIIARVAASMARDMVSGTAVSSLTAADLRSVVTEVVKQLEYATGLNLSLDVNNIVDSLREEGGTFWDNTGIGEYISGMTVTIPVPTIVSSYAAELEFTVDDGAVTLAKTDDETLRTAAIACAKAIAVQLYDSLQGSLYGTTLSDKTDNFELSAEVDIAFTPNDDYAETVAPYATNYTLNVTASFNSNGTILFAYNNDTIDVALNMTNPYIAGKYKSGYELALGTATVKNRIASMVESMITSDSSESNILSAINDILVEATSGSSSEESSAVSSAVTDAVTEWVVTNATNGSTETDNSAIYSLVDTLAETTIDSETVDSEYISNALTDSGVDESDAEVITTYVEKYQDAYTTAAANGETLTEADIADIKAEVASETGGDVDTILDDLIEKFLNGEIEIALSVVEDSDADSWTALIAAAEAESGSATMQDILDLLFKLGTVDGLKDCTVESLGNLLKSDLLSSYSGMVTTALKSISNINITTPASLDYAIKIKATTGSEIALDSATLEKITGSDNGIKELGEILTKNFVAGETVADLYLELYVEYAPVSMNIDFSLYFGE